MMAETIKSTDSFIKEPIQLLFDEKGIINPTKPDFGKALTRFYMAEIGQHIYKIYEDDIDAALECDGKGDLNIDFAHHYLEDNSFLIIQSKYKGNKSSVNSDELSGFFNIHERILDESYRNKYANEAVKYALADLNDSSTFHYIFLTNCKLTDWLISEFDRMKAFKEGMYENVSFTYVSLSEIKRELAKVKAIGDVIPKEVEIYIEQISDTIIGSKRHSYLDLSAVVDAEGHYKSILCTIKGTQLKNLFRQHGTPLFNYNIRGWLGENDINKKVRKTLESEPEKFYFYNNGISAICTDYEPVFNQDNQLNRIKFRDFQIINGAQTTTTIGRFPDDGKLSKVRVLLKITKAECLKKERKGLNKNIITYNNSQTVIKASDFRANDEIQAFLASQLPHYTYRGSTPYKQIIYTSKRTKEENRKRDCKHKLYISIETLARVLYVFDNDPILIFKGTRTLFDTDEKNGKYWSLFGEQNKEVTFFSPSRMNEIAGIIILWAKLEEILKRTIREKRAAGKEKTIDYQALLAKWHFLWAYAEIINRLYADQKSSIWKKLTDCKSLDGDNNFVELWFRKIYRTIAETIEDNYQKDKNENCQQDSEDENIQSFNFKNWLRNHSALEILKNRFKRIQKEDYPA